MTYDVSAPARPELPDPPAGLILETASWYYEQSALPSKVYAIAASLGTLAGIAGGEFQISGTGLNGNFMVVGGSASGKDIVNAGPQKLFAEINKRSWNNQASEFRGPPFASGTGALRHLEHRTETECQCRSVHRCERPALSLNN